jgi:hypothetical protein
MILSVGLAALVLAGSPYRPLPDEKVPATRAFCAKENQVAVGKAVSAATAPGGIPNLPYAMGRRFRTLDEYLVHLKCRAAPIDLPWWREVRPGIYRFETTRPGAPQQLATRAELMKRFGFAE